MKGKDLIFTAISAIIIIVFTEAVHAEPLDILVHPIAPFIETDENKNIDGIAVRRITEAFCRMGQKKPSFRMQPWARSYSDIEKNRADAILVIYKNSERELFLDYTDNYIGIHQMILAVRKDFKALNSAPEDLKDLKNYKSDYTRGYYLGSTLEGLKGKYIPDKGKSINSDMAVRKLLNGRVDILIIQKNALLSVLNKNKIYDKIKILDPGIQEIPFYIAFPKKRNKTFIIDQIDKAIESMMNDGSFKKISDEYLGGNSPDYKCANKLMQ